MISSPQLVQRFVNRPLALEPAARAVVMEMLRGPAGLTMPGVDARPVDRPYELVAGVAIVPIRGILVHGTGCWWWDETDYGRIAAKLLTALDDPQVSAVALLIDSPGGEVAGCFDLADAIYAMRGVKPIWAILDESAYSAAYALASAADHITVPRTGGAGSIGIVTMHVDITAALEQVGIKVTTVQYGERKTDSYPTTPLSEAAQKRLQADIDQLGELFVATVARNRGISADRVRETEAGTFLGEAGIAAGLADSVMSPGDAFLSLVATLG